MLTLNGEMKVTDSELYDAIADAGLDPDELFPESVLESWAEDAGYRKNQLTDDKTELEVVHWIYDHYTKEECITIIMKLLMKVVQ